MMSRPSALDHAPEFAAGRAGFGAVPAVQRLGLRLRLPLCAAVAAARIEGGV